METEQLNLTQTGSLTHNEDLHHTKEEKNKSVTTWYK